MMKRAFLPGLILVLAGCHSQPAIQQREGVRFIQWQQKGCTLEVSRLGNSHFSVSAEPSGCDPASEEYVKELASSLGRLVRAAPVEGAVMTLYFYLPGSPRLLQRWSDILERSPEWKSRPALKNAWDTSDYALIRKLMIQERLFEVYAPVFQAMRGSWQDVTIEKVADISFNAKSLRVPLMTTLRLEVLPS